MGWMRQKPTRVRRLCLAILAAQLWVAGASGEAPLDLTQQELEELRALGYIDYAPEIADVGKSGATPGSPWRRRATRHVSGSVLSMPESIPMCTGIVSVTRKNAAAPIRSEHYLKYLSAIISVNYAAARKSLTPFGATL